MKWLAIAPVLALAACGERTPAQGPVAAPAPKVAPAAQPLRFDWSPPCRVPVMQRTLSNGREAVISFAIDIRELGEYELAVDHVDYEVISIDGKDLSGPQHAQERAMVLKMSAARPTLVLDREGTFLRVDRIFDMVDLFLAVWPPQEHARMREFLSQPDALSMLADKFASSWVSAVGMWIGVTVESGKTIVATRGTITHLGIDDGLVHLRYDERVEGEEFHDAMSALLLPMYAGFHHGAPDGAMEYDEFLEHIDGFRDLRYEVVTDPETLRPRRTLSDLRWELLFDGAPRKAQHDTHETEYVWDRAVGCGQ